MSENEPPQLGVHRIVMPWCEIVQEEILLVGDKNSLCMLLRDEVLKLRATLQQVALLADTGSDLHREAFGHDSATGWTANGWRVAEKMREVANDVVGNLPVVDDSIYKRAMESMAAQFVHPKMTARELAELQLKGEACGKS